MHSDNISVSNASDCLCIVDVQTQFMHSSIGDLEAQAKFVGKIKRLAANYDHVVGVEFDIDDGYAGEEICYGVSQVSDSVFVKLTVDAFECDEFADYLNCSQIESIDFVGVETNCCVLQSFLSAIEAGYRCRVIEDLCAASSKKAHDLAMAMMLSYEKELSGAA